MIPHLQNNLSSQNQELQYKLMCGKTIVLKLSKLLCSAAQMSNPKTARVKAYLIVIFVPWFFMCLLRLEESQNAQPQVVQMYGLSPVCCHWCTTIR